MQPEGAYKALFFTGPEPREGQEYSLDKKEMVFGRGSACDIVIDKGDDKASRRHATVIIADENVRVIDMASTNGVFVNDEKIAREHNLRHLDKVGLGRSHFIFIDEGFLVDEQGLDGRFDEGTFPLEPDFINTIDYQQFDSFFESLRAGKGDKTACAEGGELSRLFHLHNTFLAETDLKSLLRKIMKIAFDLIPADKGFIVLYDENKGVLTPASARSRVRGEEMTRFAASRQMVDKMREIGESIMINDCPKDPAFRESITFKLHKIRSIIASPFLKKGKFYGYIQLYTTFSGGKLRKEHLKKLDEIAHLALGPLEGTRQIEDMKVEADPYKYLPPKIYEGIQKGEIVPRSPEKKDAAALSFEIRNMNQIPPGEVFWVINRIFDIARKIILDRQGIITTFTGEVLTSFFEKEWSGRSEDETLLAAYQAGVEIMRGIDDFNGRRGLQGNIPVEICLSVNSGEVITGNLGDSRLEFLVLGKAAREVKELRRKAEVSQLLAGENLREKLGKKIDAQVITVGYKRGEPDPLTGYIIDWKLSQKERETRTRMDGVFKI